MQRKTVMKKPNASRQKNLALLGVLVAIIVLIFFLTIFKLSGA